MAVAAEDFNESSFAVKRFLILAVSILSLTCRQALADGIVLRTSVLSTGAALPSAARNVFMEYTTVASDGSTVPVTGTLAIPRGEPPTGGWPIIAWAHGTTGNAPQCAPSSFAKPDGEQRMLDAWVAAGYAVVQTDYEGEGTLGIHPYFVAQAAMRDVTDSVRAARTIDPQIGTRWIAMGHSEGGAAALSTAAYAAKWAPELTLLGAISYAPGSHLSGILLNTLPYSDPINYFLFIPMMIEGMATEDPHLHLSDLFSAKGMAMLPDLQRECNWTLVKKPQWSQISPPTFFKKNADFSRLLHDYRNNEPTRLHISVPVLLLQGTADTVVSPAMTTDLDLGLCLRGGHIEYETVAGADHFTLLRKTLPRALSWAARRFSGKPAKENCPTSASL